MDKKRFQTHRTPRRLIHCIAVCSVCGWGEDAYLTTAREATKHVRDTGHSVTVEQGVNYVVSAHGGEPTHKQETQG